MISLATIVDSLEGRENSVEEVLQVGIERRTYGGRVFGFAYAGRFEVILEVGVIGGFELVLPADVVGVASGPADFVVAHCSKQTLGWPSS